MYVLVGCNRAKKKTGERKLREESESEVWNGDVLECPEKRHICVVIHRAEVELGSSLRDTDLESFLSIGKTERAVLGCEGMVGVVEILGGLTVGKMGGGSRRLLHAR